MRYVLSLCLLVVSACQPQNDVDSLVATHQQSLTVQQLQSLALGGIGFTAETFQGNGRTCATCHRLEAKTTFTPAIAQALFALNPNDPLFRAKDSDDRQGHGYTRLLNFAVVNIPFVLPDNVTVSEPNGDLVQHDFPTMGKTTVWVPRSTPTVNNIFAETTSAPVDTVGGAIMWDGREGSNLAQQAIDAVNTHADPGRQPTATEAANIAFFQQEIFFSGFNTAAYAFGGPDPVLPPGVTDSQKRGRNFFIASGPVVDATHRGFCATCHGGPMLNTTTSGNPVQPPGQRISNNLVSETNMVFGNQFPELTYNVTLTAPALGPFGPDGVPTILLPGTVLSAKTSDPGRILTTGNPCELVLNCVLNPGSFLSLTKIPTLWGSPDTAPYFHDNSAVDIHSVMDRYVLLSEITAQGTQNPFWALSSQDRADIEAYFPLLR